jgi:hypothetical protein
LQRGDGGAIGVDRCVLLQWLQRWHLCHLCSIFGAALNQAQGGKIFPWCWPASHTEANRFLLSPWLICPQQLSPLEQWCQAVITAWMNITAWRQSWDWRAGMKTQV